ncbi:hypothetical protein [Dickeya sp. NCPPB 3274]|uniref:hypothetical protein n=1 Tax=Dickeya sp. NCPPB 3274 TaxID=568766 RepID=UPI0003A1FABE|nr:hypothetical protein [Dickeya sp. NCPPB 3274]
MLLKLFDQSINLPDARMRSRMDKPRYAAAGGPLWFLVNAATNRHLSADAPVKC